MSKPDKEPRQSTSDIIFMVILAVWMTIIYCERLIKDIMVFYNYNITKALTEQVEIYFCFIVGCALIIASMIIEKSHVEKVSKWFKERIKSKFKIKIQNLTVVILIIVIVLYIGMKKKLDLLNTLLYFKNEFIVDLKWEFIVLVLFAIVSVLAWLINEALGKSEKDPIAVVIREFVLGIPFIFLWWGIYYFIIYGTSIKASMSDYGYNNGLLKDSSLYTFMAAIFVNGMYSFKLSFPKLEITTRWKILGIFAAFALVAAISQIYVDLKYNEKVIFTIENYEQKDKLMDATIAQILKEYPEKRDLELVSKHIFRRDFIIVSPFIIFIFLGMIWNIYSVPNKNKMRKSRFVPSEAVF